MTIVGSRLTRRVAALVVMMVAAAIVIALLLPPRAVPLPADSLIPEPVRGAVHVHSRQSDGTGTTDQIAAAAARAGLTFVILTDHGDARREPEPPSYRGGVLCIDAVEVTTLDGHVVVLGLWGPAPYPLGGEARDVVDDVARLGGMSIAAHPASAKPSLAWKAWDTPVDGLEWLNADSEWREESVASLARAVLTYPIRRPETMASLMDRPVSVLRQWDALTKNRRVVGLAGADAHANVGLATRSVNIGDRTRFALPGYDVSFRTFSIALPGLVLTGDADVDARAVVREIRGGHVYSSIEALARPGRLALTATSAGRTAGPGDELPAAGAVAIRASTNAPAGSRLVLLADGREVAAADGATLAYDAPPGRSAYRLEVYLAGALTDGSGLPWLVSNPIYVGGVNGVPPAPAKAPVETLVPDAWMDVRSGGPLSPHRWGIEKNSDSLGDANVVQGAREGKRVLFRYALGGSPSDSPWVALGMRSGPGLARFDRVMFTARTDVPTRLWVTLWMPVPTGNVYWHRSVYLDSTEREISVRFADMRPVADAPATPSLADVQSIMFMVDQVHTPIGGSGRVWIDGIKYAR